MPNADISRHLFQPEKRYVGAIMQQGRVITDEDLNAHRRLHAEDLRQSLRDIICAKGSPNSGFRVEGLTNAIYPGLDNPVTDFSIRDGSFYVGGLRFEALPSQPETFLSQRDWLQVDVDPAELPAVPSLGDLTDPSGDFIDRYDLVYLNAWEQLVTATEDRELLEYALGGPDTSVYQRRMRRIEVLEDTEDNCADAAADLRDFLTAPFPQDDSGQPHAFDAASCELLSKSLLTVTFADNGQNTDLCQPPVLQGYLGAENQAIRIQLTDTNRFIWGFDNAAPLYRVRVTQEDGLDTIEFLTLPRDELAQPVSGQAVEILPWGALLSNQEKAAEFQGHLSTVASSFDPATNRIQIQDAIPQSWLDWLNDPSNAPYLNERDEPTDQRYFYLRVWTGGSGNTQPDHAFTPGAGPGNEVDLAGTGLQVRFSDFGLPGSFWIIAARPNTPDEVVPWILTSDAPPLGPRHFYAPLALIRWSVLNQQVVGSVHDCRSRFRPLCQLKGCCTVIVGDGSASHGEFTSIQDAIDALPEAGGEVCVLRGRYEEHIRVANRANVKIKGCGPETLIVAQNEDAVIDIRDSSRIEITSLGIEAPIAPAVIAYSSDPKAPNVGISINHLHIASRDDLSIGVARSNHVKILHNRIRVGNLAEPLPESGIVGRQAAIFVAGEDILIERNSVLVERARSAALRGYGGIHVGGGTERIELRRNHISGGNNHGIVLGTVITREIQPEPGADGFAAFPPFGVGGFVIVIDERGCVHIYPIPPGDDPDNPDTETEPGPPIRDIRIVDNLIENMGMSGISALRFFDMETDPNFLSVERISILENRIQNCMRNELGAIPLALRDVSAVGGIALADAERLEIRDNLIERNGFGSSDAICGIFVLHGEGVGIDGNRILYNGSPDDNVEQLPNPGRRGGIVLAFARAPTTEIAPFGTSYTGKRQDGIPAAHIHDNIVVSPQGRALEMVALGPVSVEGNEFTAKGSSLRLNLNRIVGSTTGVTPEGAASSSNPFLALVDLLGGSAVSIVNLGVSNEMFLQLAGLSGLFMLDDLPTEEAIANEDDPRFFVGGNILFNDNQVVLDAFGPGLTLTLSSILLLTIDDISFHDNQCDCDLVIDYVVCHLLALGFSAHVSDNRLKEGAVQARLSGLTFGLMNNTSSNTATHCMVPIIPSAAPSHFLYAEGNIALQELNPDTPCPRIRGRFVGNFDSNTNYGAVTYNPVG